MRRGFLAIATALLLVGAAPPKVGHEAPGFRLRDQNGKVVRLADGRGQKVVLVFYRGYW